MATVTHSSDILAQAREATDHATVSRVFGTPVERDGALVIPVAVVSGGGGGGSGSGTGAHATDDGGKPDTEGEGGGGGFGFSARPAGVYVLRNGEATWKPAVDVNRIVLGGQLVAVVAFLVARSVLRRRRRR
ncbi:MULTISPECIES: spore germination protein GerW family protein [Actinoplanes]|uniref:spore germination protein GerW family protein n=1 Tax=Actinoplanes TaxID=1865 RepID=UPI0005F2999E|nr:MULTISPECIES: spore germination protein GerW family protein [Actinoplanes]GLX99817.1 hypothetical protein Acsp01_01970 [Actinoplanes sp. NBRC 101535]